MEGFRELWCLVRDAIAAMRSLLWAFILLFLCLSMWSVFAVELLNHPAKELGCDDCDEAFSSVMRANLTFFGIVAFGEGWSEVAMPLINKHAWCALIFLGVVFTTMFGLMNILIATMIENANTGRQKDLETTAMQKEAAKAKQQAEWLKLCAELDGNSNGKLSLEELEEAVKNVPEFRNLLLAMDVGSEEMYCIFRLLDEDNSGDVSYGEFANQLWKMRNAEHGPVLMMIKSYVHMIWANTKRRGERTLKNVQKCLTHDSNHTNDSDHTDPTGRTKNSGSVKSDTEQSQSQDPLFKEPANTLPVHKPASILPLRSSNDTAAQQTLQSDLQQMQSSNDTAAQQTFQSDLQKMQSDVQLMQKICSQMQSFSTNHVPGSTPFDNVMVDTISHHHSQNPPTLSQCQTSSDATSQNNSVNEFSRLRERVARVTFCSQTPVLFTPAEATFKKSQIDTNVGCQDVQKTTTSECSAFNHASSYSKDTSKDVSQCQITTPAEFDAAEHAATRASPSIAEARSRAGQEATMPQESHSASEADSASTNVPTISISIDRDAPRVRLSISEAKGESQCQMMTPAKHQDATGVPNYVDKIQLLE